MKEYIKSIEQHMTEHLEYLQEITDSAVGITRLAFTDRDWQGRAYLISLMEQVGLTVREDAFGNVFGHLPGKNKTAQLPVIMCGSHGDSVPQGGNYDGIVGVLTAIEVACLLQDETGQSVLEHPYEVAIFMNEEGSRFGAATLGSRALVGDLKQADLDCLVDKKGITLRNALRARNLDDSKIGERLYKQPIHAFLEAHIEQGRVLENAGYHLGVVTGIAAPTRYMLRLVGRADHSGATPMAMREDALCGAAQVILKAESLARKMGELAREAAVLQERNFTVEGMTIEAKDLAPVVATVGTMAITPGAMNVIPGDVQLGIDIRSISKVAKNTVCQALIEYVEMVCNERNLSCEFKLIVDEMPVPVEREMIELLTHAAQSVGIDSMALPSGAGHDAMNMAKITHTGMLFIPCKDGISHNPKEAASVTHMGQAVLVMAQAIKVLDKKEF